MIWFLLWGVIVVAILGVMFWNLSLLMKQKKAMRLYAKKNNLEFFPNKMTQASTIQGEVMGCKLLITPEMIQSLDMRGTRQLTLIQLIFDGKVPVGGAIGTGVFKGFVEDLGIVNLEVFSKHNFDDNALAATKDKDAMLDYYSNDRVDALKEVMALPFVDMLYIFDETESVLQVFTADPLEAPRQIDVFVKTMLKSVSVLKVVGGENSVDKVNAEDVVEEDLDSDETSESSEALELSDAPPAEETKNA